MKQKKLRFVSAILAFVVLFSLGLAAVAPADAAGTGGADALTPMFGTELNGLTLEYAFASERAIDWTR